MLQRTNVSAPNASPIQPNMASGGLDLNVPTVAMTKQTIARSQRKRSIVTVTSKG